MTADRQEAVNWYEKAAYDGSKTAQTELAALYFDAGSYYPSYVWCCVAEMKDLDSAEDRAIGAAAMGLTATVIFSAPLLPIIGGLYVLSDVFGAERSIKEQIERAGLFNLAKLSDAQIESARYEAEKIARQIREHLKAKQQQ